MRAWLTLLWLLPIRNALRAPLRSLLTLIGVALGAAMIVGTSTSNRAIAGTFDELADRAGGKAQLEVTGDESGIDQSLVVALATRPDLIAHAAGRIEQTALLAGQGGAPPLRVLVVGLDLFGDLHFVPFRASTGPDVIADPLAFANDPHALLITDSLAQARGLSIGSHVSLRTARGVETFHVEAIAHDTGASAAYGGQVVVTSLDAAQLLFARPDKLDRIDLALPQGADVEASRKSIAGLIGDRAHVDRPSARAARLRLLTSAFTGGLSVAASVAVLIGAFLVFYAVGVAVAQRRREIGILRSIGGSRAWIAAMFLLEALFLGALGGALGAWMGGGLAKGLVAQFSPNVSRFFENIPTPTPRLDARAWTVGIALGASTAVAAALFPALQATRTTPLDALHRSAETHGTRPSIRGHLIAACLLAALAAAFASKGRAGGASFGLLSVLCLFSAGAAFGRPAVRWLHAPLAKVFGQLFGVGARIGVDAAGRSLARSGQAVAALTLAGALGITLAAYTKSYETTCMAWVEEAIPADVIVAAGSPLLDHSVVAIEPRWREVVAATPGVEAVNLVRSLSVPYRDVRIEVASVETRIYLGRIAKSPYRRVVEGPFPIPIDALSQEPTALISENLARKQGLHPGDTLDLPTPTGTQKLRIVAIVLDYSNDQGWVLIDRAFYTQFFKDERIEALHVYASAGVDPAALADTLRARVAAVDTLDAPSDGGTSDTGLFVTTSAAFKSEVRQVIHQTFGISQAAEAVALIVALLSVLGTMLAAIIDRQREIGVLRAIGAMRRQIVAGAMAESAALALVASLVASAVAIPAAMLFIDVIAFSASGWRVDLRFPWLDAARLCLTMTAVAGLAGALATVGRLAAIAPRA